MDTMLKRIAETMMKIGTGSKFAVSRNLIWNKQSLKDLSAIFKSFDADVMHCTNLFPLISMSAYEAANQHNVPIVQSLRNYRSFCLNSFLYKQNSVCERCKNNTFAWPGVLNGCYKGSILGSAILATHNAFHRLRKTQTSRVDLFFTPTEFARQRYIEAGWPADSIVVKPNFLNGETAHSGEGRHDSGERKFAIFVGRLSEEKGIRWLINT